MTTAPALAFIFVTVVLDMLALGMILPVLPKLIIGFLGGDTAHGAQVYGLFASVWAVMQFFFSPILGALSDRFGRRPVILLSNFGLGLDYVLMAVAPTIGWLFVGRVISGITAASISTSFAYIADVLPPAKRAKGFGLVGAAFGVGFILGPALGGLFGGISPRMPFWVAAALSLANATYGMFILPESHRPENRAAFSWRRANPIAALSLFRRHRELLGLGVASFFAHLAHAAWPSVFVLYTGYRYHWGDRMVGAALALVGVCSMVVQAGLVGPFVSRLGERGTLAFGFLCGIAGFLISAFADDTRLFALAIVVNSLWGLTGPTMQGLMTRHVSATEQGRLQGAGQSLMAIAEIVGPAIFTFTFSAFIAPTRATPVPGAPFVVAGAILATALGISWYTTRDVRPAS